MSCIYNFTQTKDRISFKQIFCNTMLSFQPLKTVSNDNHFLNVYKLRNLWLHVLFCFALLFVFCFFFVFCLLFFVGFFLIHYLRHFRPPFIVSLSPHIHIYINNTLNLSKRFVIPNIILDAFIACQSHNFATHFTNENKNSYSWVHS